MNLLRGITSAIATFKASKSRARRHARSHNPIAQTPRFGYRDDPQPSHSARAPPLRPILRRPIRLPCFITTNNHLIIVHPFPSRARTASSKLSRAHGNDLILAIARFNIEEDGHAEFRVANGGAEFVGRCLDGLDGEDVDFFVFLVETPLMDLFEGLDVEFVFALNVLVVFFYFDKVGGEGGPALGLGDGP